MNDRSTYAPETSASALGKLQKVLQMLAAGEAEAGVVPAEGDFALRLLSVHQNEVRRFVTHLIWKSTSVFPQRWIEKHLPNLKRQEFLDEPEPERKIRTIAFYMGTWTFEEIIEVYKAFGISVHVPEGCSIRDWDPYTARNMRMVLPSYAGKPREVREWAVRHGNQNQLMELRELMIVCLYYWYFMREVGLFHDVLLVDRVVCRMGTRFFQCSGITKNSEFAIAAVGPNMTTCSVALSCPL